MTYRLAAQLSSIALTTVTSLAFVAALPAADSAASAGSEIERLETEMFESAATADHIDQLLMQLNEEDQRAVAQAELSRTGHSFTEKIIEFARTADDVDARQACADIIQALDAAHRTSPLGKQLAAHYRNHARELLPDYWKRFRKNPLDHRAVAMLLAPEPEDVDEWLKQSADEHDRLRYLLLRVRELSPDKFALERLRLHADRQIQRVLPDVFPIVTGNKKNYCHRVVGHVALGIVGRGSVWNPDDKPYTGLSFSRQAVVVFRSRPYYRQGAIVQYGYHFNSYYYSPAARTEIYRGPWGLTRGLVASFPGLHRAPQLRLSNEERLAWTRNAVENPWWVKQRLPESLQRRLQFAARNENESEPIALDRVEIEVASLKPFVGATKAAPSSAPSVVVLPPKVSDDAHPGIPQAAEAACDRLAGELAADGNIQIVNRTELERILDERKISGELKRPNTSYAAMIRLEVDTTGREPRTLVKVLDLSTGNVLGEKEFGWPLEEPDVAPMKVLCEGALKRRGNEAGEKTRIRWLGVIETGGQVRMQPLATRLHAAFAEALAQSKDVSIVHHLEAESSQEESLLLLMGLSRLPDGGQFTPQADATIELRVTEGDGVGKTFDETPVAIGVRVRDAEHPGNDWTEVEGVVKNLDPLIEQAWQWLTRQLAVVEPNSAGDVLEEMGVRRSQAEAELRAASNLFGDGYTSERNEDKARSAMPHLEAALKIDPTFPEPHLMLARMYVGESEIERRVLAAQAYVEHPQSESDRWREALGHAVLALNRSRWFTTDSRAEIEITEENRRLVPALKSLVEHAVAPRLRITDAAYLPYAVRVVDRGMLFMEVPVQERIRWLDGILKELDRLAADVELVPPYFHETYGSNIRRTRIAAAELALEDGLNDRAQRLLTEARVGIKPQDRLLSLLLTEIGRLTRQLDDAEALQDFEKWEKSLSNPIGLLSIKWPQADVWNDDGEQTTSGHRRPKPPPLQPEVPFVDIVRNNQYLSPIAVDQSRAYLMASNLRSQIPVWTYGGGAYHGLKVPQLAIVRLDDSGSPVGQATEVPLQEGRGKMTVWEPFHIAPQPENVRAYGKLFVQAHDGKLYLGTKSNGLLVFDPQEASWKAYGPEQGFPMKSVNSFFFLDQEQLYVAGGEFTANAQHFTFNLSTGEVKLLHKADRATQEYYSPRLVPMWWNDGKLVDRLHTDLLSERPEYRADWQTIPLGSALDAAEINGRRFFTTEEGLYEHDGHGETVRSWLVRSATRTSHYFSIPRLNATPPRGHFMVRAGKLLVFVHLKAKGIVAFDPESETWYGPLGNWEVFHAVGAEHGFWLAHESSRDRITSRGTAYVTARDVVQAARQAGREYTSQQYREKLQAHAEQLPPLDRAKLAVMLRDHSGALEILTELRDADPANAEAIFLCGLVNDQWGLGQPARALADYRALANHPDPSAQATGLFFEMMMHQESKDYRQIARVCERMLRDFPNLDSRLHANVEGWLSHAKQSAP